MNDRLLEYYKEEISNLRESGEVFAKQFPDIARRIDFSGSTSSDPQMERLIESIAFISARIKCQNDTLMLDAARLLLECIYRDVLDPIPSTGMVEFFIDEDVSQSFGNSFIPRGEEVLIKNDNGPDYKFITTCDTTISPVVIDDVSYIEGEDIGLIDGKYLHIKLRWVGSKNANKHNKLNIFFTGPNKYLLWENLITTNGDVYFFENKEKFNSSAKLTPVGLKQEESIFTDSNAYPGFRALMEYMVFPEKFIGISINIGVDYSEFLDMYLPVANTLTKINKGNILINTVPIVNFYYTSSEPMFFDPKTTEQIVIGNTDGYKYERICRILSVFKLNQETGVNEYIPNYFDINKNIGRNKQSIYWQEVKRNNAKGIENTYLSLMNINFADSQITDNDVLYAKLLCSNRKPSENINVFSEITVEKALPISEIKLVNGLSDEVMLNVSDDYMWKLITLLSLNSLSLNGDNDLKQIENIINFFKDMLNISNSKENLSNAIKNISVDSSTKHILKDGWRGFVHGYCVTLELDRNNCNSPVLFGAIMEKIFSNFVQMDSFVDVAVMSGGGVIKKWSMGNGVIPSI